MATECCPRCGSEDVTAGITRGIREGTGFFVPRGLRRWSFRFWPGVRASAHSIACLSCGLLWSSVAPEELRAFLDKHGADDRTEPSEEEPKILVGPRLGLVVVTLLILLLGVAAYFFFGL